MNRHGMSFLLILDDCRQSYNVITKGKQYNTYLRFVITLGPMHDNVQQSIVNEMAVFSSVCIGSRVVTLFQFACAW